MKPVKCTVIGDFSVGKTSVIYSYLGKNINNVQTTLGIEFFTKSLKIKGEDMVLTIWDTAGAERFQSLTDSYLRNSDVIIIVYDLSKRTSNLSYWMRRAEQHDASVIGVLGNKNDLTCANTEDLQDMLFPWTRQNFKIITGYGSSRNRDSLRHFFRKCLIGMTKNADEFSEFLPVVSLQQKTSKNRTCCS